MAFHPNDFIQINAEMNQSMVEQAIQWLDLKNTDCVLDLFCGLGNFSLPIAKQVQTVLGIAGDQGMVNRALENAMSNNIKNVTFLK